MSEGRAYEEERTRLEETLGEIDRQMAGIGPRYYGDDYIEQVLDAKREETRARLTLLAAEPYFGRIDWREEGKPEAVPLYIGKRGMDRTDTNEPYVIDWRAPVASLFYSFTGGEAAVEYEAPDGVIAGEVHRKRNVSVRDRELQRVVDSYVRGGDNLGLSDEFLLYRLGERKDNRLRDIVSTIQAEQDEIIRAPKNKALIIQGAAGSGKTTVALHRLAYLLYRYQEQIRAERMIIFAPNAMFLDYISGVLPELGVGNVRQTTFADWALELLGDVRLAAPEESERWFRVKDARPAIDAITPGRFKGSVAYKDWIDGELKRYEAEYLPKQPFEAWEGRVLPLGTLQEWFETEYRHYPLAERKDRLVARINRWLEMQLAEIADPKRRKDRSKTGKARMRAYAGKLPSADVLAFYRYLFGVSTAGSSKRGKAEGAGAGVSADSDCPAAGRIPEALADATRTDLRRGVVRAEDLPALVWIHRAFRGTSGQRFDHVVIDEAQDVSPYQVELLKAYMGEPSFTVLGDLAQGIHAYRGVHRWEELSGLFEPSYRAYHELRQSYRSTLEIIEFANRFIPFTDTGLPPAMPVFRSGEPVETVRLDSGDEQAAWIRTYADAARGQGMRTIAVIGRTAEDCERMHVLLTAAGLEASLLEEGQSAYRGGLSVVPVHLAKGLEFDAVVVFDADARRYTTDAQDAKLLYVGCTRALHRLALLYSGDASPLLA